MIVLRRVVHALIRLLMNRIKLSFDTCRGSYKTCGLCLEQHWMPSSATKDAKAVSNLGILHRVCQSTICFI